jgi:hypothetical protein
MNHTHHLTAVNEPTPIKCAPDVIGIIEEVTWPLSLAPIMKLCSSRLESKTARGKVTDKPWHILNPPTSSRGAGKPNAHTDLGIYEKKIVQRPQYRKSFEEAERNWNRNKDRNKKYSKSSFRNKNRLLRMCSMQGTTSQILRKMFKKTPQSKPARNIICIRAEVAGSSTTPSGYASAEMLSKYKKM